MYVAVGSANPVKLAATARVFEDATRVDAVPVASGVPEQPSGTRETVHGARNRTRRALAADPQDRVGSEGRDAPGPDAEGNANGDGSPTAGYDLGVGIEGGVAERPGVEGLFLVMWAAVTDGSRIEVGAGPALRLPDGVARRVREGEGLGTVMDDLLETEGVARGRGAAGVLTGGAIDRESALASAVAGAAGPFLTDLYGDPE